MGRMHSYFGDLAEAETTLRQALHLYREVAEQYPSQSTYSDDLAFSNIFLAEVLEKRMKLSEAESCFRQALVVREQNVADVPKAEMYRIHIIRIHLGLQSVLNAVGHTEEAEEHYQQAIHQARRLAEIAQEQVAESPDDVKRYVGLGKAYLILAKVMQEQPSFEHYSETILHPVQRAGESLQWLDRASEVLGQASGGIYVDKVAKARALAHTTLGQHEEAIKAWDEAIAASSEVWQPDLQVLKATSRIQVEPVESVIQDVEELAAFAHEVSAHYNMACVYALAISRSKDNSIEYAERAMELLSGAVEANGPRLGPWWHATPALDALREREDFQQLVARTTSPPQTARD